MIVDAQSPHSRHWINHLVKKGHEVHLVSTYPIDPKSLPIKSYLLAPVDFSAKARGQEKAQSMGTATGKSGFISKLRGSKLWKALALLRNQLAPYLVKKQAKTVKKFIVNVNPDIVHSMRIPFEGLLTHAATKGINAPFVASTWGNDFTLFATRDPNIKKLTLELLKDVSGLHSDCAKDIAIARSWGLGSNKPTVVAPGNGGIDQKIFHPTEYQGQVRSKLNLPEEVPIVINPRGLKEYVRNDTFFAAIPIVLKEVPNCLFLAISMQNKPAAEAWVEQYGIQQNTVLLPSVSHSEMAQYFQASNIIVSSSDHDGTPNSLLEGMACGCFPIAGDIESSHEWVTDGVDGFIHDQSSPESLAEAIINAIKSPDIIAKAKMLNQEKITERCTIEASVRNLEAFYNQVLEAK